MQLAGFQLPVDPAAGADGFYNYLVGLLIDCVNHAQAGDAVTKPAFKRAVQPLHIRVPRGVIFENFEATIEEALGLRWSLFVKPLGFRGEANLKHAGAGVASIR